MIFLGDFLLNLILIIDGSQGFHFVWLLDRAWSSIFGTIFCWNYDHQGIQWRASNYFHENQPNRSGKQDGSCWLIMWMMLLTPMKFLFHERNELLRKQKKSMLRDIQQHSNDDYSHNKQQQRFESKRIFVWLFLMILLAELFLSRQKQSQIFDRKMLVNLEESLTKVNERNIDWIDGSTNVIAKLERRYRKIRRASNQFESNDELKRDENDRFDGIETMNWIVLRWTYCENAWTESNWHLVQIWFSS